MIKRILALIILFYILALFQSSFLVHFNFFLGQLGWSLILISVILINLLERSKNCLGYFSAGIGGFFLDIFSKNFIGFYILILMGITIFIKFILKKYISLPTWKDVLRIKK